MLQTHKVYKYLPFLLQYVQQIFCLILFSFASVEWKCSFISYRIFQNTKTYNSKVRVLIYIYNYAFKFICYKYTATEQICDFILNAFFFLLLFEAVRKISMKYCARFFHFFQIDIQNGYSRLYKVKVKIYTNCQPDVWVLFSICTLYDRSTVVYNYKL